MTPFLAEITRDIHQALLMAQRSYRRAVWVRGYNRVIHKSTARYFIDKARDLRLQRDRMLIRSAEMRKAA
jgi:hypothetical protein